MASAGLPQGKIVDTLVSHLDLVMTLLDAAGVEVPRGLRGHSLLPMIRDGQRAYPQYAFAESQGSGKLTGAFIMCNLPGKPESAAVERALHQILTSLVDPDAVTEQAFERQRHMLMQMYRRILPASFARD